MNTTDDGNNNNNEDDINNNNTNNGENDQQRKGKGRKKISMEKIENEANLQVTFSKRRAGVFKKASELNTLCGAESAVVVFSPGNKPHSFGHPNVETVANRFLNASNYSYRNPQGNTADHLMMAQSETAMHQRNHELITIEAHLEREKQHKRELDEIVKVNPPLDHLTYEQLGQMKNVVASFKREFDANLKRKANETLSWANPNPNPSPHQHQGRLRSHAQAVYGYGASNIVPTVLGGSSSSSVGYPFDNFGYTVQYPSIGPSGSGFNYGSNLATAVPFDGTGRATGSGSRSGTGNMRMNRNGMGSDEDPDVSASNHDTGFDGNHGNSF